MEKNKKVKYPGKRVTTNGNQLVAQTEALISEAGVFYPITPSTEMGETYQLAYAKGELNAFGKSLLAIETEGEHAAQGGAIAISVTGKRTVNFTSGQGVLYGLEQYFHAPGKLSTMVLEVGARALTRHALNVHCGHDDVYATLDTGWIVTFAKDAQQAADQAIILRKVTELSLNPGLNAQDGFLTTHLERTFLKPEAALIREFLGDPNDSIDCPTAPQQELFGNTRRRIPAAIDLKNPAAIGPVQNQEHYMNGVAARRNNFSEFIIGFFEKAYEEYGKLTGRNYGLISQYHCENADTVFVALGSAAENIEAAVDYIKETRNENAGIIHVNVLRPFPEEAIVKALKGKKRVIILERTEEPLAGDNPLTRDIKVALDKATTNFIKNTYEGITPLNPTDKPEILSGVYGLGSRDFRPEGILGAYDFALGKIARQDGKKYGEGTNFFFLGIDHPYAVIAKETPSLLPKNSIAVRMHSIGGWGMITTGKNLGEILGEFSSYIAQRDKLVEDNGDVKEVINISANPKYGSEKKGAPTNYFMVAAPERVRVNCDLHHVDTVLCCDPKIFLHTNPLEGIAENGSFVWESNETSGEKAWQRIPKIHRQTIIDKKIRVYILNGFDIAKKATNRVDLQTRMQGNSFLGAFFKVSPFLKIWNIPAAEFLETVNKQYHKKFGRFGEKVVSDNMTVMQAGFDNVIEVPYGDVNAPDYSSFIGLLSKPCHTPEGGGCSVDRVSAEHKAPLFKMSYFDSEFRAGLGYDQPASVLSSVGIVAAATGETASKYVARREVPIWLAENCTQCMDCISVCPDSALPNTAQDISTVIATAVNNYVNNETDKKAIISHITTIDAAIRAEMLANVNDKEKETKTPFTEIVVNTLKSIEGLTVSDASIADLETILKITPFAYANTKGIFSGKEKKEAGEGGLFLIGLRDTCKGCGACVEICEKSAIYMSPESEQLVADNLSSMEFINLLPKTPSKYLGIFDQNHVQSSKAAALQYHSMIQSNYYSFLAGDGACAGCGEKTVLKYVATLTETLMRPLYHTKADRLKAKAEVLRNKGVKALATLKTKDIEAYNTFRKSVLHILMGYGSETSKVTESRIATEFKGNDNDIINTIAIVLEQESENHKQLQAIEGKHANGMSVMAMAAHTGCNSVYGSTPPNNPHSYPWMNSLFQDGATIGWLMSESFIVDHSNRSVIPERLADFVVNDFENTFGEDEYFRFTHFSDTYMTDREIAELPKIWAIGGDGGMGDIGFQNLSKVILQNRPNMNMLLLDTQVYSNTGGQNSDSSVLAGGFDMNQTGAATQGKLTERKSVAESFMNGHGSPFVAQVSMANPANYFKAIIDGLTYRGTAFFQAFTSCPPEHGIADYSSAEQALNVRDSRGMAEFVFNSGLGESFADALNINANPSSTTDWMKKAAPITKKPYTFTVAHWAFTEARFRQHHKIVKEEETKGMIRLEDILQLITMNDIVNRKYLDINHRAFIPDFGVYTIAFKTDGSPQYQALSTQMVIFCVERRKAWRMLQSRAGVVNTDYIAQKELLAKIDKGELTVKDFLSKNIEV